MAVVPSLDEWRRQGEADEARQRRAEAEREAQRAAEFAAQGQEWWADLWRKVAVVAEGIVAPAIEALRASLTAQFDRRLDRHEGESIAQFDRAFDRRVIEVERKFESRLAELETRMRTTAAPLPQARSWEPDAAALTGELFVFGGALWQAKKTTGSMPREGVNWTLLAAAGRDGEDGRGLKIRGTYRPEGTYRELDVVMVNGSSFVATRDAPPPDCPGEGWQALALVGKRGDPGSPGPRGPVGLSAPPATITGWLVDEDGYTVRAMMSTSEISPPLDLRPLFARFQDETSPE
jgi:hypothetical protein